MVYRNLYKRKGIPMKLFIPLRKYLETKLNHRLESIAQEILKQDLYQGKKKINNLIVSLTSFPERINDVWKVIVSLKSQTYLPEKIILWLSLEQFPDKRIPKILRELEDDVFSIKFVKEDIRSYKKFFYAMQEFPDSSIITVDDDMYYHRDMIRLLLEKSEIHPDCVISSRVRKIKYREGEVAPYERWSTLVRVKDNEDLCQIGVDGVLYPAGSLPAVSFDKNIFLRIAPTADDLWLNAMLRLNGKKVLRSGKTYINVPVSPESPSLEDLNCGDGRNDLQLASIRKYIRERFNCDLYSRKEK